MSAISIIAIFATLGLITTAIPAAHAGQLQTVQQFCVDWSSIRQQYLMVGRKIEGNARTLAPAKRYS
jgi:hypothetical protein